MYWRENLSFPPFVFVLVPHWIGDERLGGIYIKTSHAYCYECWAMGHIPTRANTPNRAGRVQVVRAHDLRTRMQFDSGACWTCYIFLLVFYFYLKFCWDFRVKLDPFKRIGSACCNYSRMITDSPGLLQTERSVEGYKYLISAWFFTKNRNRSALFLSQISYIYSVGKNCVLAIGFWCFLKVVFPLTGN